MEKEREQEEKEQSSGKEKGKGGGKEGSIFRKRALLINRQKASRKNPQRYLQR